MIIIVKNCDCPGWCHHWWIIICGNVMSVSDSIIREGVKKNNIFLNDFWEKKTANFPRSLLIPCALTSASGSSSFATVKTEPKFQVCLLDVCTILKEILIVIFFKQTCIVILNAFLTPAFHSPLLSPSSSTEWMQSFRLCTPSLALEPGTAQHIKHQHQRQSQHKY